MNYKYIAIVCLVLTGFISFSYLNAWTPPSAVPPSGNVDAPINVGDAPQIKSGGLGVDSLDVAGGAIVYGTAEPTDVDFTVTGKIGAREYCDEFGQNCSSTPGGGAGGGDTIIIGGQCFEPAWAVTCNWNWSGDGNDNSTYIVPLYLNPTTQGCLASGRSYQYHSMILAECAAAPVYAWVVGTYSCNAPTPRTCGTTTGSYVRSVYCRDQYGRTVADSYCPAPKPATTGGSCTKTVSGCGSD